MSTRPTILIASDDHPAPEGAPRCAECGRSLRWAVNIAEWGEIDHTSEYASETVLRDLTDCVTDCFLPEAYCLRCGEDGDKADETRQAFEEWLVDRINSGTEQYLVVADKKGAASIIFLWDEHDRTRREAMEWAAHPVLPLFQDGGR